MRAVLLFVVVSSMACGGGASSEEDGPKTDAAIADTSVDTAEVESPEVATDTSPPPWTCAAAGAACAAPAECCSGTCVAGKCAALGTATLDDDRDRVLDTWAGLHGNVDRCVAWGKLDDVQKGIFLTHTDMLGNRSCMQSGGCADLALSHVWKLWAINGSDPTCSCSKTDTGYNCCNGGAEWHRIFFTAADELIQRMRTRSGLPEWGPSKDLAGPHAPFSQSNETSTGTPRGQIHFWAKDADASTLKRTGVEGVDDPHVVELDNDYNLLHDSNPEGCYGVFGLGCSYGRVAFKKSWSGKGNLAKTTFRGNGEPSAISELASDDIWSPRCPTAMVSNVVLASGTLSIVGTGFLPESVVHVRTRASEWVLGPTSISVTATKIELKAPAGADWASAYAWVVEKGVLSNLMPVTLPE